MALEDQEYAQLVKRFDQLEASVGVSVLRSAMRSALKPTLVLMAQQAPHGTKAHRSYRHRLLPPGFLSAKGTLRLLIKKNKVGGVLDAVIGVRREAFYGVLYYDKGVAQHITGRRLKGRGIKRPLKRPYGLKPKHWFKDVLVSDRSNILTRFKRDMAVIMKRRGV